MSNVIETAKVLKVMDIRVISDKFKVKEVVLEIDGKNKEGEIKYFNSLNIWSASVDVSSPKNEDMKTTLNEPSEDLPF